MENLKSIFQSFLIKGNIIIYERQIGVQLKFVHTEVMIFAIHSYVSYFTGIQQRAFEILFFKIKFHSYDRAFSSAMYFQRHLSSQYYWSNASNE